MSDLTQVELIWLKKRIENWIRFGRIVQESVLDRNRRIVSFTPDSLLSSVGAGTTMALSSRTSTFCAR